MSDQLPDPMNFRGPMWRSPYKKCERSGHVFGPLAGVHPVFHQCKRCNYVEWETADDTDPGDLEIGPPEDASNKSRPRHTGAIARTFRRIAA